MRVTALASQNPLPGLQKAVFQLCPHMAERGRDWGWRTLFSSSYNGTDPTMGTSSLWPHLNLMSPQIPTSKYHHMGKRTLPYEFRTYKHSVHWASFMKLGSPLWMSQLMFSTADRMAEVTLCILQGQVIKTPRTFSLLSWDASSWNPEPFEARQPCREITRVLRWITSTAHQESSEDTCP